MSRASAVFRQYFNLNSDKEEEAETVAGITRNIQFRGANLWMLIFAIIIASVGLNVNSTAVIIGAMLISPLMGPIMGIGLGIAISDFEVVRKGLKNLFVAVLFSIATSALYFLITPLQNATPELLARTTPTIWDVFIAFTGGLAGIVGATRKEKTNAIPGVAIATALMPPLCTVGYGLATGQWFYSLGAFYLFFINSVFICTATVLGARFMRFHKHVFEDEARRRRVTRSLVLIVLITVAPSIWLAYGIVKKAVFENAAQRFVQNELGFRNTQVVNSRFVYDAKKPRIELLLIGDLLDSAQIDTLQAHLARYNLKGDSLVIHQGLNAQKQVDVAQLRASILEGSFLRPDSAGTAAAPAQAPKGAGFPDLKAELHVLFPQLTAYILDKVAVMRIDAKGADSVLLFVATGSNSMLSAADQQRLQGWLNARLAPDTVSVLYKRQL